MDADMVDLVEEEIKELLAKQGFTDSPVIKGSGLKALEATSAEDPWAQKVKELVDTMDSYFPEPVRELDKPFLMPIEDIFSIEGRGTVVTGKIERGTVKVGEEVEIVVSTQRLRRPSLVSKCSTSSSRKVRLATTLVFSSAVLRRTMSIAVRCLLRSGSVTPHTDFEAEVYILSKDEGGRHTPFFSGYKPQFYVRTTDVTGEVTLPDGKEMVMPGDTVTFKVKLVAPIALEDNTRFAIREGGRTVGAGVVTKIVA